MRRTREEALETRERILDCAETVFVEKGVAHATLADIAATAGVTRGAIYGHFMNKTDVYEAMVARVKLPMDALFDAANDPEAADPLAMLRHALSACMSQMAENPRTTRVFTVLLTDRRDGPAGWLRDRERQGASEARNRLALALRNAVRRQQLPADLHIERAAAVLKSALSGVLRDWLIDTTALSLPQDATRIAEALIDMLSSSPSLRESA